MEYYDILVSVYGASRPGATPHRPGECASFAGVSSLSTLPEGPTVRHFLPEPGWTIGCEGSRRKAVKIELPPRVHGGQYEFLHMHFLGLHTDYCPRDRMGPFVYVWCNVSAKQEGTDCEAAIDAAIASGITLSVPQIDGKRVEIPAKVVAVSDLYAATAPSNFHFEPL